MSDYAYEGVRRLVYGDGGEFDGATFVPVCMGADGKGGCGRYVKADPSVTCNHKGLAPQPNATCSRCGRVQMVFEGYV